MRDESVEDQSVEDHSVDRGLDGTTELRVHGVSGTTPESILGGHPLLKEVAGDRQAAFWRRWYPGGRSADLGASRRLEAYSWGGLTSGSAKRAAWLLLLPFMLANVAHWMLPPVPDASTPLQQRAARVAVVVLRLFGVTLTLTMLLTAVQVAVDLAGWQCGRLSRCAASSNVLGVLTSGFLDTPGRRVAVTALVPLAVVLLLGLVGRRPVRTTVPQPDTATPTATQLPLAQRTFWAGNPGMVVLRTLHVAAATAVLAALVAWPATTLVATGAGRVLGLVVCLAALACLAAAVALVAVERVAGRETPTPADRDATRGLASHRTAVLVRRTSLGLLVAATVLSVWGFDRPWQAAGRMPGLRAAILLTFALQLLLLVLLVVAVGLQRPWRQPAGSTVSMAGLGAPVVAAVSFLVAGGFSAGLAYRVAELFGHPVLSQRAASAELLANATIAEDPDRPFGERLAAATAETPLVVPPSFAWAGAAATVLIVAVLLVAAWLALGVRRRLPGLVAQVLTEYADQDGQQDPAAARPVARARAVASLTDGAGRVVGGIVALSGALLIAGLVAYAPGSDNWRFVEEPPLSTMTRFGTWAMGLFALGLVVLFWNAYRNAGLRRTVGILWDVGSFWPRAAHPLAPPSYGERAVPDLADRVEELTAAPDGRVLLSGHSQGSVLVAAAVLVLPQEATRRVAVLTHGSPLRRLYAQLFPAYVGGLTLDAVQTSVAGRWRNLYRDTDPIGSWVLDPPPTPEGPTTVQRVDRRLRDPRALGRDVRGHSDYWGDPGYAAAATELEAALGAELSAAPAGVQPPRQPSR